MKSTATLHPGQLVTTPFGPAHIRDIRPGLFARDIEVETLGGKVLKFWEPDVEPLISDARAR